MTLPNFADDTLARYQWENRPLVIALARDTDAATAKKIATQLSQAEAELRDRDMVIINLSPTDIKLPIQEQLKPEEVTQMRADFKLTNPDENVFLLFGKDGGQKLRQTKSLQLKKIFQLIDSMPMRKQEMKNQ